jgi:hypothetical protein
LIVACFCNFAAPRLPPMPSCYSTANWTMPLGLTDTGAGTLAALTGKNSRHLLRGMVARALVQVSQMILWIEKLSEILIMERTSGELTLPLSSLGGGRLQPFIMRSPGILAELSLCKRRSEN